MKSVCALLRQKTRKLCRDCGEAPCVCNCEADWREDNFRRRLHEETTFAFAEARAESGRFWDRVAAARAEAAEGEGE